MFFLCNSMFVELNVFLYLVDKMMCFCMQFYVFVFVLCVCVCKSTLCIWVCRNLYEIAFVCVGLYVYVDFFVGWNDVLLYVTLCLWLRSLHMIFVCNSMFVLLALCNTTSCIWLYRNLCEIAFICVYLYVYIWIFYCTYLFLYITYLYMYVCVFVV